MVSVLNDVRLAARSVCKNNRSCFQDRLLDCVGRNMTGL